MRVLPGEAQNIGARGSQQDSFGFGDPGDEAFLAHGGFVAVVCDGMGGMEHGDKASRTAVSAFLDAYRRKTPQESIADALERCVREANDRVVEMAHELGAAESVGTTLVAAVIAESGFQGKGMYFISVGDSGLFHVSDGRIQTVNKPHIFANLLDRAVTRGAMSKEQALLHPERESLTSFIGVDILEEIDRNMDPWPLRDGDTILLASDGLFKTLTPEEILESLEGQPQKWPEILVARTLARKYEHQDNVTVLSVTVADNPDTLKAAADRASRDVAPSPLPPPSPPGMRWLWLTFGLAALLIAGAIGVTILLPRFLHRNDAAANNTPNLPANPAQVKPADSGVGSNPGTAATNDAGTSPAGAPAADSAAEAGLGYDALYSEGAASAAAGDSESAVKLYLQAIQLQPQEPNAYAALGEIYLYRIGDLPEALKYYHAAVARDGTVTFHVHHGRSGGNLPASDDRLMLSNSTVSFVAGNGLDSFRVTRAEVKVARRNRVMGLFTHRQNAFHIRLESGKDYNFTPGSRFPGAERDLILAILGTG